MGRSTGHERELVRRGGLLRMARRARRQSLSPTDRSRMGTRGARRVGSEALHLGRRAAANAAALCRIVGRGAGTRRTPPPERLWAIRHLRNVHEWLADWYDANYYRVSPPRNPQGPVAGVRRASRGGSWRHQIKIARVAARSSLQPEYQYSDYGFRCAMSL